MKLVLNRESLIRTLQLVVGITDKSTTKPILANFLFSAETQGENATLHFFATDYDLSLRGSMTGKVNKAGAVCTHARRMLDVCSAMRSEEVELAEEDNLWVSLKGGNAKTRFPAVEISLYPKMDDETLPSRFKMSAAAFQRSMEMTLFAVQANESRKNLSGVRCKVENGEESKTLHLAATDGHRLSVVQRSIDWLAGEDPPEVIVPRRAMEEMRKMLGRAGDKDEVEVSFDARSFRLQAKQLAISTRLVDGKFPDVDAVIPQDMEKQLSVEKTSLLNGLKLIYAMSEQKIKPVKLAVSSGKVLLHSERSEQGEANDEVGVEYSGDAFEIGFNAQYIMDVLEVLSSQQVSMEFKGALNPCIIRSAAEAGFLSVVMPLRLDW